MRTLVLDLPGLSWRLLQRLGEAERPRWLNELTERGVSVIDPVLPAVTMPVQATYTTGVLPERHGVVANGLAGLGDPDVLGHLDLDSFAEYRRNVSFWEQSNHLLTAPRLWQTPEADGTVAMLFFQSSIGAADVVVTPKPVHGADGSTISACWTNPPQLAGELDAGLGRFPLHHYWGPRAGLDGSRWIVDAARHVWRHHPTDLQLTYIPHLDYDNQRLGPSDARNVEALKQTLHAVGPLVEPARHDQARIVLLSEYGMTEVRRPVAPNVLLREAGLLAVDSRGEIDYRRSDAWAMCDHQVAHVYGADEVAQQRAVTILAERSEVASIHVGAQRAAIGLNTPRAGHLVALARPDAWFEYRWWSDWSEAPDYAWTIDIHRKPGYDPTEMFMDRQTRRIQADQPQLVRGSHGARPDDPADWPVLLGVASAPDEVPATDVAGILIGRSAG